MDDDDEKVDNEILMLTMTMTLEVGWQKKGRLSTYSEAGRWCRIKVMGHPSAVQAE